jgi:hypothetical protein
MSTDVSEEYFASIFFATCFMLVSCLVYSSTLKIDGIFSSEKSMDCKALYPRRYLNERCETLKSYEGKLNVQDRVRTWKR